MKQQMRGKILTLLALMLILPAMANAWYVNAKTSPASGYGTISPSGNVYVPGTTGTSADFTVTPAAGRKLVRVTLDGVNINPVDGVYTVPYAAGKSWRYIVAYFAADTISITTAITGGSGAIREDTFESLTNIPLGSSRTLLVIPNPGYTHASLTATGSPTITDNPDGSKSVSYVNLQASQNVSASFSLIPVLTVSAGPDVNVNGTSAEFAATLYGSATSNQGSIDYQWSGDGLMFGTPTAASTTVYATTPGMYTATLTVTSGGVVKSDTATVNVISRTDYLVSECAGCHGGKDAAIFDAYNVSMHKTTSLMVVACQTCHDPTGAGHFTESRPTGSCYTCHSTIPTSTHAVPSLANLCLNCHDAHSTVVTDVNLTSHSDGAFGVAAQYLGQNTNCADCHANTDFFANEAILDQFAASGHADVNSPAWVTSASHDWPVADACKRCHSTTGFVDLVTGSSTAVEPGQPGQILACNACHVSLVDVPGGYAGDLLHRPGMYTANFSNGASASFADLGGSNLCIRCHSGRESGNSIKLSTADFANTNFINSHYLAVGSTMFRYGYHFVADNGYANSDPNNPMYFYMHGGIAVSDGGPCAACHMGSSRDHDFSALEKDESGLVLAIKSDLCAGCHSSGNPFFPVISVEEMNSLAAGYAAALDALEAKLEDKGVHYASAYPYFFTAPYVAGASNTAFTNWNGVYSNGKSVMGAAFNYNLLRHEKGAYVHNQLYARRLIFDAIDFVDNGEINGTLDLTGFDAAAAYLRPGYTNIEAVTRP